MITHTPVRGDVDHSRHRNAMVRMPVGFGPSPGPRRGPDGNPFDPSISKRTTTFYISYETEARPVERLLPPGFRLVKPMVTVRAALFTDIRWLGGRSYAIFGV